MPSAANLARTGVRAAFTELVRRYQDRLFRFVACMVGSRDALGSVQDAFIKVWQAVPGWQPHAPARLAPALATFGSLLGGFALGLSLAVAPTPRAVPLPAAMAVFDAVLPGGICLVAASCPSRGAGRRIDAH